jgi:hypothetical protein
MQSVYQEPVVQAAQQLLDARRGTDDEDDEDTGPPRQPTQQAPAQRPAQAQRPTTPIVEPDLETPPAPYVAQPIRGSVAGDPQTVEQWVEALVSKGWSDETAMSLAAHKPDEPIGDALKAEILSIAFAYFDRDAAAVREAFDGTGFVPMPNLPEQLKPKPTGLQLLRFAIKLDLSTKTQA